MTVDDVIALIKKAQTRKDRMPTPGELLVIEIERLREIDKKYKAAFNDAS